MAQKEEFGIVNWVDPAFKREVSRMHGAEKLSLCFQCGTCTAGCPISRFNKFYNPRRIARMIQLGLKDRLLSNNALWLCTTCYTCIDNCPQGVEMAYIVRALRNIAVEERRVMPAIYKQMLSNILKVGYVYVIPESRIKRRSQQGLPPLPKSDSKQIAKIFDASNLSDILEKAETFDRVVLGNE